MSDQLLENTLIWDSLSETDPDFTRPFDRGGFKGTDINPTWKWRKLTEVFGPVGKGWGVESLDWRITTMPSNEVMVTVCVVGWYMDGDEKRLTPPGFGTDYMLRNTRSSGLKSDDEGAKKALTDALGKAFSFVGLCADVHMKLHDDSKYVSYLRAKLHNDPPPPDPDPEPSSNTTVPEKPTTVIEGMRTAIMMAANFKELMEAIDNNAIVIAEFDPEGEALKYAVTDWTMKRLSNVKTTRGLNMTWSKIASDVNGIKTKHPVVYDAIRAGFNAKKGKL